jgi:hypothetical protein
MEEEPAEHKYLAERIHTPDTKDSQDKADSLAFVKDSPQMGDKVESPVPEPGCPASDRMVDTRGIQDREGRQRERGAPPMDLRVMSLTHAHDG